MEMFLALEFARQYSGNDDAGFPKIHWNFKGEKNLSLFLNSIKSQMRNGFFNWALIF